MTPKTKIITGIALVAIASFAGYKIYQHYQIKKHFPKNTNNDDDKSAMSGDFKHAINQNYKTPLWVVN